MENRTVGRPALKTSVRAMLLEYMQQTGQPLTGKQIRQWGRQQGIEIDSITQARYRLLRTGKIRQVSGDDVNRWEVVE